MAEQANMICPSCQTFQPKAEICTNCGVVIAKVQKSVYGADTNTDSVSKETSKPPFPKMVMIVLIGIPIIGFILFTGSGGKNADNEVKSKTQQIDPIDQIAVVKPAVAENIQRTKVQSKLHSLKTMLYMYGTEGGMPPSNEQGLQALVKSGYLKKHEITDAWGNIFAYRLEWDKETPWGKEYKIYVHSKGPDGISGNADDVLMP